MEINSILEKTANCRIYSATELVYKKWKGTSIIDEALEYVEDIAVSDPAHDISHIG